MGQKLANKLSEPDKDGENGLMPVGVSKMYRTLGPGILFAAGAVGTSHIVQSTRAGADYGLWMAVFILFVCFIKYPIFRFGTDYAAATGDTLIDSYFRQGRWAVAVYGLELLATMFVFTSAVTIVTAGLVNHVLQLDVSVILVCVLLLALCAVVLISGRYQFFENVIKGVVILFLVLILVAVALTVPDLHWGYTPPGEAAAVQFDRTTILFMIALAGFMPIGAGASVFQSLWVRAKSAQLGRPMTLVEARFDLNLGYLVTVLLALCFLAMGTVLMFQSGVAVADSTTGFAGQLIRLFTDSIGEFARPIIVIAVIAVMFSTMLTMIDACPRAVSALLNYEVDHGPDAGSKSQQPPLDKSADHENRYYVPLVVVQCVGATLVLVFFATSFKAFIDFATTIAFLTAPALAFLNHRAVHSEEMPIDARPSTVMSAWSILGIAIMGTLTLSYLLFLAIT
ncbi:MAG: Mn2+/Fe2+ NRAMP family transporter [Halioglobus sp.]|jgi:Mn2+/Fe2+ NRAMP family transporter